MALESAALQLSLSSLSDEAEANCLGLQLNKSRLVELQPLAGRNPMLAKKVIRREQIG